MQHKKRGLSKSKWAHAAAIEMGMVGAAVYLALSFAFTLALYESSSATIGMVPFKAAIWSGVLLQHSFCVLRAGWSAFMAAGACGEMGMRKRVAERSGVR